jgi:hypothetical protein
MSQQVNKAGYIVRHWRGEFGLAYAWWVNGLLMALALAIIREGLNQYFEANAGQLSLGTVLTLLFSYLAFAVVVCVWQAVGTWRSASQHVARGGKRFWSVLAKIFIVIATLRTIVTILKTLTEIIPLLN